MSTKFGNGNLMCSCWGLATNVPISDECRNRHVRHKVPLRLQESMHIGCGHRVRMTALPPLSPLENDRLKRQLAEALHCFHITHISPFYTGLLSLFHQKAHRATNSDLKKSTVVDTIAALLTLPHARFQLTLKIDYVCDWDLSMIRDLITIDPSGDIIITVDLARLFLAYANGRSGATTPKDLEALLARPADRTTPA